MARPELNARISLNTKKFRTALRRLRRQSKRFARAITKPFAAITKSMLKLGVVAGGVALAGVIALTRSIVNQADHVAKLSKRLGISTDALQQFRFVADRAGIGFGQFTISLQRMSRRLGEFAAMGRGEAGPALKALALDAKALSQLPIEEQFLAIGEALNQVTNDSVRLSLAFKFFDSEGVAVLQALEQGTDKLRKQMARAKKLGAFMSPQQVKAAERFKDSILDVRDAIRGMLTQILSSDALNKMAKQLEKVAERIEAIASSEVFQTTVNNFIKGVKAMALEIVAFGNTLLDMSDESIKAFRNMAVGIAAVAIMIPLIFSKMGLLAVAVLTTALAGLKLGKIIGESFGFTTLIRLVQSFGNFLVSQVGNIGEQMGNIMMDRFLGPIQRLAKLLPETLLNKLRKDLPGIDVILEKNFNPKNALANTTKEFRKAADEWDKILKDFDKEPPTGNVTEGIAEALAKIKKQMKDFGIVDAFDDFVANFKKNLERLKVGGGTQPFKIDEPGDKEKGTTTATTETTTALKGLIQLAGQFNRIMLRGSDRLLQSMKRVRDEQKKQIGPMAKLLKQQANANKKGAIGPMAQMLADKKALDNFKFPKFKLDATALSDVGQFGAGARVGAKIDSMGRLVKLASDRNNILTLIAQKLPSPALFG